MWKIMSQVAFLGMASGFALIAPPLALVAFLETEPAHAQSAEQRRQIGVWSGCVPGGKVSPRRATNFYDASEQNPLIADIGETFDVDGSDPISQDRCSVTTRTLAGETLRGSLPLIDIGPLKSVKAQIARQSYNVVEDVDLAAFQDKLHAGLSARAHDLGFDPARFDQQITSISDLVRLCAGITAEELDAAVARAQRREERATFDKFRDCSLFSAGLLGMTVQNSQRNLLVHLFLRSPTYNRRYRVTVQFMADKADHLIPPSQSITESVYHLFDAYGIMNAYVN